MLDGEPINVGSARHDLPRTWDLAVVESGVGMDEGGGARTALILDPPCIAVKKLIEDAAGSIASSNGNSSRGWGLALDAVEPGARYLAGFTVDVVATDRREGKFHRGLMAPDTPSSGSVASML